MLLSMWNFLQKVVVGTRVAFERQFCTTGPGGIGVGYEWDGSQLDHPNPRRTDTP